MLYIGRVDVYTSEHVFFNGMLIMKQTKINHDEPKMNKNIHPLFSQQLDFLFLFKQG
jgi:hypothetical protein